MKEGMLFPFAWVSAECGWESHFGTLLSQMVEYLTSTKSDINLWKQRHCICMSWNRYDSVGALIFLSLGGF